MTDREPTRLPSEGVLDALSMILSGAPLDEVLTAIARLVEAQSGMLCSIMLLDPDGQHLHYGAAPSIPEPVRRATNGVAIGPNFGSCSAAAYLREPVYVSDIQTDPRWARYRDAIAQTDLRAAWSSPILSPDGAVLGTYGMYYRDVRSPDAGDVKLLESASRIVGIAIESDRSRRALRTAFNELKQSEGEMRQVVDAIMQSTVVMSPDSNVLYANRFVLDYTGLTKDEVMGPRFRELVFHPDDLDRLREKRSRGFAEGVPWENEVRIRRRDGQYRWFLIHYSPLVDDRGRLTRWFAAGTDIDDRKRTEEQLRKENLALREEIDRSSMYEEIVGSSPPLRRVLAQIDRVAPTDTTVLILGETGTGKELVARAIHRRSRRSDKAFIRVNCAAIPSALVASELFGHEKGAFTGALQRRVGRFEAADGGTIFLDEIGDLPGDTQIALLRVLQEREIERVGSQRPIAVDVRVVAATNRDLEAAVADGSFREDLFYRLNVVPIRVPSLRERKGDIPLLIEYLVARYSERIGRRVRSVRPETLTLLQAYEWPGNIRELQNIIERAVILCEDDMLSVDETWLRRRPGAAPASISSGVLAESQREFLDRERHTIETALAESRGRVAGPEGAAARLGVPRQTLESKIATLGIDKRQFKAPRKD